MTTPIAPAETSSSRSFVMQRTIGGILWLIVIVAMLVSWQTSPVPAPALEPVNATSEIMPAEELPPQKLVTREVSDFSLIERSGNPATKQDLQGQPWVVNFIFTKCVMSCPANTKAMMELADKVENEQVKFVTITVDPERDTPEQLTNYAEIYSADPDRWWFLTGDKEEIHELIRNSFLQVVEEKQGDERLLGYEFAHTDRVMHIDEDGTILGQYLSTDPVEMSLLAKVLDGERETPEENRFLVPETPPQAEPTSGIEETIPADPVDQPPVEQAGPVQEEQAKVPGWIKQLPAVNASLNGISTLLLLAGFIFIQQKQVTAHRAAMLSAFVVSVLFLACYLTYHFSLQYYTGESSKSFPNLGFIRQVYLTILISHILLAVPVPVLAAVTIYKAWRGQIAQHRTIARVTFPIWLYVSVTGVIIYFMLYHLAGA